MSVAACFNGKVEEEEFSQIVDLFTAVVGTTFQTFVRELVTRHARTQTFTFTGLTYAEAHSTAAVSVTDIGGATYSVPMTSSVTDGSTGTKSLETESVAVSRRRMSPHMWEVTVQRTGSEYYDNGVKFMNGPTWAFG